MKANVFQIRYAAFKQFLNKVMFPVSIVGLVGGFYFGSGLGIALAILIMLVTFLANCIWFVSSETAGVKRVFSKIEPRSYGAGWQGRIPLITDVTLVNIQPQTRQFTDIKNTVGRNKVTIDGSFCYTINRRYAHLLLQLLGENFYEEHLYQWMDAIFDSVVNQLSYPHFQATKQEVEDWCSKIIAGRIARECSSRTKDEVPMAGFDSKFYELGPVMTTAPDPKDSSRLINIPQLKPVPVGEDRIEMVPEFILTENTEHLEGVNLFENISLKINKVTFEKTYEEAQQQVAIAKSEVVKEEEKRRKALITLKTQQDIIEKKAEAEAKAILAKGQAEAEAMRLKGASENEIKERFAEICKAQPEYLKALLREHLPKVLSIGGGGATPLINLDSLLDNID